MYTGTLIRDLMAAVERAEQSAQQKRMSEERVSEEMELRRLFDLPSSQQTAIHLCGSSIMATATAAIRMAVPSGAARNTFFYRHARDLLLQGDRQFSTGKGGRSAPQPRDETIRHRARSPVPAGVHLCLAALQRDRIWLPDRIGQARTQQSDGDEPRAAPGRCLACATPNASMCWRVVWAWCRRNRDR